MAVSDLSVIYSQLTSNVLSCGEASIAVAKPSSQSSEFVSNGIRYTADRANDGKRNTVSFDAPYLSQTNGKS